MSDKDKTLKKAIDELYRMHAEAHKAQEETSKQTYISCYYGQMQGHLNAIKLLYSLMEDQPEQ